MAVHVVSYDTAEPGDTSDFSLKLADFEPSRIRKLALLVKTEGNSDTNDFSREYGMLAARLAIEKHGGLELLERSSFLFSMGCEGAMTPFGYLFVDYDDPKASVPSGGRSLVLGRARSRSLKPDEIGTLVHCGVTAQTVNAAIADAGVDVSDVALVIVKTPVTSHIPATAGHVRNRRITSAFSKAVGALGAGIALGEVDRSKVTEDVFDHDHSLYAKRAMVFSGTEFDCVETMLLANRKGAPGHLVVQTGYLKDLLDAQGLRNTLTSAGCELNERGEVADPSRVAALLTKVGIAPDGWLRGCRTTIKSSHLDMDKHIRATMSGIIGATLGTCKTFISANTVHQAPVGGGLCAVIVKA